MNIPVLVPSPCQAFSFFSRQSQQSLTAGVIIFVADWVAATEFGQPIKQVDPEPLVSISAD